jgi:endonuclease G
VTTKQRSSSVIFFLLILSIGLWWLNNRSRPETARRPERTTTPATPSRRTEARGPRTPGGRDPGARIESNLLLGNPDDAVADPSSRERYLIRRPQYVLSYNALRNRPNWVSWHLSRPDLGSVERGQFQPDPDLPDGFERVTPGDYTRSGYDRGHMCPSADRSNSREDNNATFLMTNIVPQAGGNNQGPWKELEDYTREQIEKGKEAYIVAGVADSERPRRIGRQRKITVPAYTWKVVVLLDDAPGDDLQRMDRGARVIAVKMPNRDDIRESDWRRFRVAPSEIEQLTGYRLLENVPDAARSRLLKTVDRE